MHQVGHGCDHPEQQNSFLSLTCVSLDKFIPDDCGGRALASLLAVRDESWHVIRNALRL